VTTDFGNLTPTHESTLNIKNDDLIDLSELEIEYL
jgi:hypothetical protein